MTDEKATQTPTEKPLSTLEKAALMAERIEKASIEAVKAVERLEQLKSDNLLAGTGGPRPDIQPAKPETPKDYRKRIDAEIKAGKYNDRG